jgi:hypothetical protein
MSQDFEIRQALLDYQAAVDLLLEEQRRLEALMQSRSSTLAAPQPAGGHCRNHRKGPATTLVIKVEGKTIAEPQAAAGMVKAFEHIGVAHVESLGLKLGGQPLIVRGKLPPIGRGYQRTGEWWIATHSDTAEKRHILEEICQRLGLSHSIQQVLRTSLAHLPPPPSGSASR